MGKNKITIAHLSDLHLGYSSGKRRIDKLGYNVRENDAYLAYKEAIAQILKEDIDLVLITGDMFHSPRPKNHTVLIAQEGLREMAKKCPVYILAGNHDATDVRTDIPSSRLLNEPSSNIFSYSEPYIKKEILSSKDNLFGLTIHFLSHHAFSDQQDTFKGISLDKNNINILASHGSAYDSYHGMVLHTPQEPREIVISQEIMDLDWDYTLLGHIHTRGWIGSSDGVTDTANRKQYYNGSLLRRGFSDEECKLGRGWTKWDINLETKEILPTMFIVRERPQFDLPAISAKNKTNSEIEEAIISQLQTLIKKYENESKKIDINDMPIVRQTIKDIDSMISMGINWKRFNEYTDKFLTHNFRKIPKELDKTQSSVLGEIQTQNRDIVDTFINWAKDKKLSKGISEITETALKTARDNELEEE